MKKIYAFLLMTLLSPAAQAQDLVSLASLKGLHQAGALDSVAGNILVYFWASWCPDCREKMRGPLAALQGEFPQAKVLTVNSDRDEAKGMAFVESEKISLPVYRDTEKSLSKALKLFAVPSWAVLKKHESGQWAVLKASTGFDLEQVKTQLSR